MEYIDVLAASDQAWVEFYHSLSHSGFTNDQINKLDDLLNKKDCFNAVMDCIMEVNQ